MDFYFGLVCASLLSLANARTLTSQIPTAYPLYPNFDNCGFNLSATCDDHMELFADGNLLATSDDWRHTSVVYIPPNTGQIEIRCTDRWILGGILASSYNGLITNNAWNCSSDNGVNWHGAYELGANGVTSIDISPEAKWIWTEKLTWKHTELKDHTTAICTIQLRNNSECSTSTPTPIPTRNCTELFNGTTPIPTPKSVSGFNLNATCNNKMELFVDGNLRATSFNWRDTSSVHIPENSQTIEINCSDSCWLIEGILASSDNGLITDNSWNCSSDNGITWSSAHEIVPNGLSVPDISPNAKWISTGQSTWRMAGGKVICKVNLDLPISTTTTSEGSEYTDKYVECPQLKDQCNSEEFGDCMMTDCAKTCKSTSTTTINAVGEAATSSSIYSDDSDKWGPQYSIDTKISTGNTKYFHSKRENYPWLQISLKQTTKVFDVRIVNRKDCCFNRLKNVEIRAGMEKVLVGATNQLLAINTVCATFQGPPSTNGDVHLQCETPVDAKFITIQLKDKNAILQINEVIING